MSFKERIEAIKRNVEARNDGKWEFKEPEPVDFIDQLAERMQSQREKGRLNEFITGIVEGMNDSTGATVKVLEMALTRLSEKKAKLGSGARFKAVEKEAEKSGASDPAAVAAAAGRKKYGAKKMAKMAAAGKK